MAIRYCSHNYSVFLNNACPNCGEPVRKIIDSYDTSIESYMAREKMFSVSKEQENEILNNYSYYLNNKKTRLLLLAMYFYIRRHQPTLIDSRNDLEKDEDIWALLLMITMG